MSDLAVALGLVLVIEGVLYALFPEAMQRMMRMALETPPVTLRWIGLAGALLGFWLIWAIKGG
jgi:uncharacterized protein YjeT (DUF2065 family)